MKFKYSGLKASITQLLPVPFCGGLFPLGLLPRRAIFEWLLHWTSSVQSPVVLKNLCLCKSVRFVCRSLLFPNLFVVLVSPLARFKAAGILLSVSLLSSPPSSSVCSQEVFGSGHCSLALRAGLVAVSL